jgi:hypothetical protein
MSKRHACGLVGQWRTTQRYQPTQSADEDRLTQSILALASKYGRFGYRRITALPNRERTGGIQPAGRGRVSAGVGRSRQSTSAGCGSGPGCGLPRGLAQRPASIPPAL